MGKCNNQVLQNWSVDLFNALKGSKNCFVLFVGQDDKAKIPVGDSVPVSTNARIKTKAIVPANEQLNTNKAADHDWSHASVIPSVTLLGNMPSECDGSFFSGGVEGTGQIHVALRDATFQPSDVFDHCAQLFSTIKTKHQSREQDSTTSPSSSDIEDEIEIDQILNAILLQTDGGPDHNIAFLRTQLALVGLFIALMEELGLDHLVAIRGAPHRSWLNAVERSMSILNLGLQNLALKRADMPPWAEIAAKNAGTMKGVREAHLKILSSEGKISRSRKRTANEMVEARASLDTLVNGADRIAGASLPKNIGTSASVASLANGADRIAGASLPKKIIGTNASPGSPVPRGTACLQDIIAEKNDTDTGAVCSFSCIGACEMAKFLPMPGVKMPQLVSCSREGCKRKIHHLCQTQFAHEKKLKERQGEKKVCIKHLQDFYHLGPLVAADSRFGALASRAMCMATVRTPPLNDRTTRYPDANEMHQEMAKRVKDSSQSTISLPSMLKERVGKDLKTEWVKSMNLPISQVTDRFSALDQNGRPVIVDKQCQSEVVEKLHDNLSKIDAMYDRSIRQKSQLGRMPDLKNYVDKHVVSTPYTFSIQKCGEQSCTICKPISAPEGDVRDLVLQRQPTPIQDPTRTDHFYERKKALAKFKNNQKSLTDLSDLPSKNATATHKSEMGIKKKRDAVVGGKWAPSSVRDSVACWECGKPRCLFSQKMINDEKIMKSLQTHKESHQHVCGSLLMPDDSKNSLAGIFVQRIGITCADPIEMACYNPGNNKRTRFQTPLICALCTTKYNVMEQAELEAEKISGGNKCLPMCRGCMSFGNKPAKKSNRGRKNQVKAKAEVRVAKDTAQQSRKKKKMNLEKD